MWRHSASVATLGHFVVGNILGGIAGPNLARGPRQPRRDGKEGYLAIGQGILDRDSYLPRRPHQEINVFRAECVLDPAAECQNAERSVAADQGQSAAGLDGFCTNRVS